MEDQTMNGINIFKNFKFRFCGQIFKEKLINI